MHCSLSCCLTQARQPPHQDEKQFGYSQDNQPGGTQASTLEEPQSEGEDPQWVEGIQALPGKSRTQRMIRLQLSKSCDTSPKVHPNVHTSKPGIDNAKEARVEFNQQKIGKAINADTLQKQTDKVVS